MWEIYDALIEGLPKDMVVDEMISGKCAYIRSGSGIGLGTIMAEETRPTMMSGENIVGKPLYKAAELIKSWNLVEAAVGQAALNAYYNNLEVACGNGVNVSIEKFVEDRMSNPFIAYQSQVRGKKVAVIGHFNYLQQLFAPVCDLYIFERENVDGDYPEEATEFILPECDYVFLNSSTLCLKTLPRLLELSQNAYKVLVGPSTPMSRQLFEFGINDLSGFIVKDAELAHDYASGTRQIRVYKTGQKVSLKVGGTNEI